MICLKLTLTENRRWIASASWVNVSESRPSSSQETAGSALPTSMPDTSSTSSRRSCNSRSHLGTVTGEADALVATGKSAATTGSFAPLATDAP
jgi:hypothetical protein